MKPINTEFFSLNLLAAIHWPSGRPRSNKGDCLLVQEANITVYGDMQYSSRHIFIKQARSVNQTSHWNKNIVKDC